MGNMVSGFQDYSPLRPNPPPISGQAGLQALFRAEQVDQYRKRVDESPINRLARLGQNYMPIPFSIDRIVPLTDMSEPWPSGQVIWMDPTADSGLPHTRPPNFICISKDFPQADLANTLLHERVHVSQRLHPTVWLKLFEEPWHFKPWSGSIPTDIESRLRINPDLLEAPLFIWKDMWVPLALFKSTTNPKLNEVDIVWWDAKSRTLLRSPPPGWVDFFGHIPGGEHPYEIIAYLVSANPKQNPAYNAIKSRLASLPTTAV
jgi:hypothetical protein